MIRFIKNIFKKKQKTKEEYVPDISEPVISFVETFKKNPRRFKIYTDYDLDILVNYILKDQHTKEKWSFSVRNIEYLCIGYIPDGHINNYIFVMNNFLTIKELKYIYDNLHEYFFNRIVKYTDLKYKSRKLKIKKQKEQERERLKRIYCE
jgi:hypothetical protein